jgi:hypothetical protein
LESEWYLIYKGPVVENVYGKKYDNLHAPGCQRDGWFIESWKQAFEARHVMPSMKETWEIEKDHKAHLQYSEGRT